MFHNQLLLAGSVYDPDAATYFAAMSVQPDNTRKALLNSLITGLKSDGIWNKITWLSVFAAHDAQAARVNAKNPSQVATTSGAVVFTTDRGYAGDNTSAFLSSGVAGSTITATDVSMFAYVQARATASKPLMGYQGSRFSLGGGSSSVAPTTFLQTTSVSTATTFAANEQFICAARTGTTQTLQIEDTTEDTDTVGTSAGTTTNIIRFLANDNSYTNARLAAAGWGLYLSNAEARLLKARLATYLAVVGAISAPVYYLTGPSYWAGFKANIDATIAANSSPTLSASRTTLGADLSGTEKWDGSVLSTNGKIYCAPHDAEDILIIDPATDTATRTTMGATLGSGTEKWVGGCLAKDGKIYYAPHEADKVLIIDPIAGAATLTDFGIDMSSPVAGDGRTTKWQGIVPGPNGKLYCVPFSATDILIIDPDTQTATRSTLGASSSVMNGTFKWYGGVLAPNGKIYCLPRNSGQVLIIDPVGNSATTTNFGLTLSDSAKWIGGVLGTNGKVYGVPRTSPNVLVIDTNNDTAIRTDFGLDLSAANKYQGGVLGPDGKVYCIPRSASNMLVINPATETAITTDFGINMVGSTKYLGGCLAQNGKIYSAPRNATDILVVSGFSPSFGTQILLSGYLNKF